jgi:uncharacterized membrane protein YkvA (DUF1232 family)
MTESLRFSRGCSREHPTEEGHSDGLFIPDCLTTIRRLRRDPRVPARAKLAVIFAGLWVASPIDLIPEFLPVIGPVDDAVVVALVLRYAGRHVPREVLLAAWPGNARILKRLLGPQPEPTEPAH